MVTVEAHVVDRILQLAAMRQPVTPKMAHQLINSMVEGTEVKEKVHEWKKKNLKECEIDEDGSPLLGHKYWLNSMKPHPQLKSKNALRLTPYVMTGAQLRTSHKCMSRYMMRW